MRFSLLAILLILPLSMLAQGFDGGFSCFAEKSISERWTLGGNAECNLSSCHPNGAWGALTVGAKFQVLDSVSVFALGTSSHAEYFDLENSDQIWRIAEGVRFNGRTFHHVITFDQRSLKFKPSGYDKFCSRFSYEIGHLFVGRKNPLWSLDVQSKAVCNISSDVSNSAFLQRVVLSSVLSRSISPSSSVGVKYMYMVGGKRQTYMGEAHNLHRISLFWYFRK